MKKIMLPLAAGVMAATAAFAAPVPAKKADAATPPITVDTPTFVKVASGANEWEIQTSKLAEEKASSADIKSVAAEIIKGHTEAGENLKKALAESGKPAPAPILAPKQQEQLKQLQAAAKGAEFETLYINMQAHAHTEAITLFRNFAGTGDDKNVVAFAQKTLPDIEMHTMHIKEALQAH